MNYRPDIDGLRAVAVLPVVFYHACIPGPSGGFLGVDVFFVISGFLITSIVADEIAAGRFSLISFYERRARRILPALTAVIVVSFAVGWIVLLPAEMKSLGQSAFATAFFLSNVYFTLTLDYFAPAAEFAPLLHTWSLAVEEQFYLFFPLLLMLLAWQRWYRPFWIVVGLSVFSFVAAVVVLPLKPDWVFYLIFFRAWELGAGALLALSATRPPQRRVVREGLALIGLAAILVPVFLYDAATPFPGGAALPPVLGATLLIWLGAQGGGSMVSALLAQRALVWVGLVSYSLYLWHWPILAFLRIVLETAILPLTIGLAAVLLSFTVAWLSFCFIERPFRAHPSRGFGRRSIFAITAISLVTVIGIGWTMHVSEGYPARLPSAAVEMAAFADDNNTRREDCFSQLPAEGLCAIGASTDKSASVDFLFWGDSHALAIMPGMDIAAENTGQKGVFVGGPGCPPILQIRRVSNKSSCGPQLSENVFSWLESRSDVSTVILGARWTIYVEKKRFRGQPGTDVELHWMGDSNRFPNGFDNATLVETSLRQTVTKIVETGRRVVLLGPIPEAGWNVPAAEARKALFGWAPSALVTRADYESRAGRTENILRGIADATYGVRYLPLVDLFCDVQVCRTKSADGLPLYRDNNHINQTTAQNLLPPILSEIWRPQGQ